MKEEIAKNKTGRGGEGGYILPDFSARFLYFKVAVVEMQSRHIWVSKKKTLVFSFTLILII